MRTWRPRIGRTWVLRGSHRVVTCAAQPASSISGRPPGDPAAPISESLGGNLKKLTPGLLAGTAALAVTTALVQPALAVPTASDSPDAHSQKSTKTRTDDRQGPLDAKQDRLRQKALSAIDNGARLHDRKQGGATVTLRKGPKQKADTAVEFPVNRTDKIF